MICAPAVERPAVRMGVWGRTAESSARTVQMITLQKGKPGVCAGGACGGGTVSTARRAINGSYATTVLDGTISDR